MRAAMGALQRRVERDVAVVSLDGLLTGVMERRGGGAGASPSVYIVNTGMSSSVGQDNHCGYSIVFNDVEQCSTSLHTSGEWP